MGKTGKKRGKYLRNWEKRKEKEQVRISHFLTGPGTIACPQEPKKMIES